MDHLDASSRCTNEQGLGGGLLGECISENVLLCPNIVVNTVVICLCVVLYAF